MTRQFPFPLSMSSALLPFVLLVVLVDGVAAQTDSNDSTNTHHISTTSAIIGIIIAVALFLVLCCGVQRRRRALAKPASTSYLPPFSTDNNRFPHGIQYGGSPFRSPPGSPMPSPSPFAPIPAWQRHQSEYPPPLTGSGAADADWAPPPYVKDDGNGKGQYPPPPGPPPGIEAPYSSPPGPPPPAAAHVATHSGDFTRLHSPGGAGAS
ncbi:hypothetical protein C8F01DRAFT_1177569 [Mycena amicta]|nr:hypothetical protein C8F01DRAFT_1177569 [Mycena amicta]